MRWEEWSTWMQIFSPKILSNENLSRNKNLKLTNEENHGKTELITAKLLDVPKKVTFKISLDCLLIHLSCCETRCSSRMGR